jgi:hypothetical protein
MPYVIDAALSGLLFEMLVFKRSPKGTEIIRIDSEGIIIIDLMKVAVIRNVGFLKEAPKGRRSKVLDEVQC